MVFKKRHIGLCVLAGILGFATGFFPSSVSGTELFVPGPGEWGALAATDPKNPAVVCIYHAEYASRKAGIPGRCIGQDLNEWYDATMMGQASLSEWVGILGLSISGTLPLFTESPQGTMGYRAALWATQAIDKAEASWMPHMPWSKPQGPYRIDLFDGTGEWFFSWDKYAVSLLPEAESDEPHLCAFTKINPNDGFPSALAVCTHGSTPYEFKIRFDCRQAAHQLGVREFSALSAPEIHRKATGNMGGIHEWACGPSKDPG